MIRSVIAEAWRQSPLKVVLAVPAAVAVVYVARLLLVVVIVAGQGS